MPVRKLTDDVVRWADKVAPNRRPQDTVCKLVSETSELLDAVLNKDAFAVQEEVGDLMILIVDLCNMYGVNPIDAGFEKMAINRKRKWVTEGGVLRRVRE